MICSILYGLIKSLIAWTRALTATLVILSIVGCMATTAPVKPHAPLDARMEASEPVKVISVVPQERIVKNFNQSILSSPMLTPAPSYYSPGAQASFLLVGIALATIEREIGESIDVSRQEAAERELIPLLAEVDDVDFRADFWDALEGALSQATWMDVKEFYKSTKTAEAAIEEITQEPVITLVTGYSLTKEHAFVSETVLEYYLAGTKDPAYKLAFKYFDDPFKEIETPEDRINAWAANNGRAYREALISAIEDTLTVLRNNFLNPYDARQESQPLAHDSDHKILAKESGFVVSIPIAHANKSDKANSESKKLAVTGALNGEEIKSISSGGTENANPLKEGVGGPTYSLVLLEELNQYKGIWSIEMITPKGKIRKGRVILANKDSTWDINHKSRKNSCKGLPAPIVINEATADKLVFKVLKSKALRGCSDFTANLKLINERTLIGKSDDGRKLTLIRK